MNKSKYQEALDRIGRNYYLSQESGDFEHFENLYLENKKTLQELVYLATPMKLDRDRGFPECSCGVGFHGKVENEVSDGLTINYCFNCGQSLDWNEE